LQFSRYEVRGVQMPRQGPECSFSVVRKVVASRVQTRGSAGGACAVWWCARRRGRRRQKGALVRSSARAAVCRSYARVRMLSPSPCQWVLPGTGGAQVSCVRYGRWQGGKVCGGGAQRGTRHPGWWGARVLSRVGGGGRQAQLRALPCCIWARRRRVPAL